MAIENLDELDTLITNAHPGPFFIAWSADRQFADFFVMDANNNQVRLFTVAINGDDPKNEQTLWLLAHSPDIAELVAELRARRALVADLEAKANRENPIVEAILRLFAAYPNLNLPGTIAAGFRTRFAEVKTAWQARQAEVGGGG